MTTFSRLSVSERILLGPGPSCVPPRVYRALSAPVVGHLDPQFLAVMDDVRLLLQELFQTRNRMTIPISGTGSAGMETCMVNVVEPGDRVLVCVNGVFGQRMAEVARRCGAKVTTVEAAWGEPIDPQRLADALGLGSYKVVGVVHAETSTGVLQPLREVAALVREHGALFVVDAVTSLGGVEVDVDGWQIDLCYSGTQKCLSCPPGLAPVTVGEQAMAIIAGRDAPVSSWYLDLGMLADYWGDDRVYHHTAPVSMLYALREALLLIHEEGLPVRWARHRRNHRALVRGIEAMGLAMAVDTPYRLPTLNTVLVPERVDEARVRRCLLERFGVEIGAGLGVLRGKVWRIGLMGHSSSLRNVVLLLSALEVALAEQGVRVPAGSAVAAAAHE